VANLLLGMQNDFQTNTREDVSMSSHRFPSSSSSSGVNYHSHIDPFPMPSIDPVFHQHTPFYDNFTRDHNQQTNASIPDESFAILNHLQTITEQTLALQVINLLVITLS
jgi:hypothetical protein